MTVSLYHVTVAVDDGPDRLTILDDLSLAVGAGEVIALTGESGSGKSTLLAVAGLLRRPDAGTVHVAGTDMAGKTVILGALILASIAAYFVSVALGTAFGIAACVWFACGFHGISRAFPTLPGAPDCLNREVKR